MMIDAEKDAYNVIKDDLNDVELNDVICKGIMESIGTKTFAFAIYLIKSLIKKCPSENLMLDYANLIKEEIDFSVKEWVKK